MEFSCPHCTEVLLSHAAKANHVRWKHKNPGYSPEGLQKIRENIQKTNEARTAQGEWVTETRVCRCGKSFSTLFKTNYKRKGRTTCSQKCSKQREHTTDSKKKTSDSVKRWIKEHPGEFSDYQERISRNNTRRSSKAERALAEKLKMLGFKRGRVVFASPVNFAVDMMSADGRVWVESDGEYHFRKVHKTHDFEKTQLRDRTEEEEARRRHALLLRVDNQKFTLDEQVKFIWDSVAEWTGHGDVKKLF